MLLPSQQRSTHMQGQNALTWFEIPATNLARASQFYGAVIGRPLERQTFGPNELMVFPYQQPGVGGCLMNYKSLQPGSQGTVVYLAISDSLEAALARVTRAGGSVALDRTELPEGMGCYAHIIDTEGNRVGLHAAN